MYESLVPLRTLKLSLASLVLRRYSLCRIKLYSENRGVKLCQKQAENGSLIIFVNFDDTRKLHISDWLILCYENLIVYQKKK